MANKAHGVGLRSDPPPRATSGTFPFAVQIYAPAPSDPTGGLKDLADSVRKLRQRLDAHEAFDRQQSERLGKVPSK